jgi:class 3 adenylate cyclase
VFEDPAAVLFYRRLASFARVIHFDRRGTGGSDAAPVDARPPWELYAEELTAVLDAAEAERAAILAMFDVGPMAISFAATRLQRTAALILANTSARHLADDDYPIGIPPEAAEAMRAGMEAYWGTEELVRLLVPSRADDERFRRWHAKLQRATASPQTVQTFIHASYAVDARPMLPLVQAPTLVLHRREFGLVPIEHGRYLAERVPDATLVELPGADGPLVWETPELALDAIQEFLTGVRRAVAPDQTLATVLFTDIVASTQRAGQVGDRRWRELLELHDQTARRWVEAFHGTLVKTTGDGILATFDSPARAIRCAAALGEDLRGLGIQIGAGLHTGEIELRHGDVGDVGGMGVHIAARVMAAAGPGDILVSRTVHDLVVGSGIVLRDRGVAPAEGRRRRMAAAGGGRLLTRQGAGGFPRATANQPTTRDLGPGSPRRQAPAATRPARAASGLPAQQWRLGGHGRHPKHRPVGRRVQALRSERRCRAGDQQRARPLTERS